MPHYQFVIVIASGWSYTSGEWRFFFRNDRSVAGEKKAHSMNNKSDEQLIPDGGIDMVISRCNWLPDKKYKRN